MSWGGGYRKWICEQCEACSGRLSVQPHTAGRMPTDSY